MKEEREILTRQSILKKLVYEAKRSMLGSLFMCILASVLFGMMMLLLFSASHVTLIPKLIVAFFYLPVLISCIFFFVRALLRMIKAKHGKFTVIEDILTEIYDNKINIIKLIIHGGKHTLLGNKAHLEHVFKFKSGKTFIANAEEYRNTGLDSVAKFSLPEDSFFLVFYNDSPNKIILLFSSKTYIYKGEK